MTSLRDAGQQRGERVIADADADAGSDSGRDLSLHGTNRLRGDPARPGHTFAGEAAERDEKFRWRAARPINLTVEK